RLDTVDAPVQCLWLDNRPILDGFVQSLLRVYPVQPAPIPVQSRPIPDRASTHARWQLEWTALPVLAPSQVRGAADGQSLRRTKCESDHAVRITPAPEPWLSRSEPKPDPDDRETTVPMHHGIGLQLRRSASNGKHPRDAFPGRTREGLSQNVRWP